MRFFKYCIYCVSCGEYGYLNHINVASIKILLDTEVLDLVMQAA